MQRDGLPRDVSGPTMAETGPTVLDYMVVVRRRFRVLLLVVVLALLSSAGISYFVLSDVYSATTTLLISRQESPVDYSAVLLGQQLAKTYGEIVKSRSIIEEVIRDLHLPYTADELADRIGVRAVSDTQLLRVTVNDVDPGRASVIANHLALVFSGKVTDLMRTNNVAIVDPAVPAEQPVRPQPLLNIAVAGLVGLVAGLVVVFGLERLDGTIKTAEDVETHLGVPVLAEIPEIPALEPGATSRRDPARDVGQAVGGAVPVGWSPGSSPAEGR